MRRSRSRSRDRKRTSIGIIDRKKRERPLRKSTHCRCPGRPSSRRHGHCEPRRGAHAVEVPKKCQGWRGSREEGLEEFLRRRRREKKTSKTGLRSSTSFVDSSLHSLSFLFLFLLSFAFVRRRVGDPAARQPHRERGRGRSLVPLSLQAHTQTLAARAGGGRNERRERKKKATTLPTSTSRWGRRSPLRRAASSSPLPPPPLRSRPPPQLRRGSRSTSACSRSASFWRSR